MDARERLERYVEATFEGVIGDLGSTFGGRNEALRDAAIRIGLLVERGLVEEAKAVQRLLEAARSNGYADKDGEREARSTIRRGLRFGAEEGTLPDELEEILRAVAAQHGTNGTNGRNGAHTAERRVEDRTPPTDEILTLWSNAIGVEYDRDAIAYLESRGINPVAVQENDLARILEVQGECPRWARSADGPWTRTGHRLLFPLFDARGVLRSLIARDVTGRAARKSLSAAGARKGLLMADGIGRALLAGRGGAPRVVICEGEIDYALVASQRGESDESAVLGIFSGSWQAEHAKRIPDGAELVIATDNDEAGEKYAGAIAETLSKRRVRIARWKSNAGDVTKAGGLARGIVIPLVRPGAPLDPRAVLATWRTEGALVHEPTGFAKLDEITRGGLVYGTTTYLQGAPNASKTIIVLQIAHHYAERGIVVGLMASDEDASDLMTRLAQRIGFERDDVEKREHGAIDVLERRLGHLPILFFDDETTIEQAAEELVRVANGRRCMLGVDSIQVVRCGLESASEREISEQRAITARTIALRRLAAKHRMIIIATSETSRASYRARTEDDRIEDIAAGKGSGSIEFKSKVLLTVRKVKRAPGVYSVSPTKNKLQRDDSDEPFYLKLDRSRQVLEDTDKPPPADDSERAERAEQAEKREAERNGRVEKMEEQILAALAKARVKGANITARSDLLSLTKGEQRLKNQAVSNLIASGRLQGGRGKPFTPRLGDGEGQSEEASA